MFLDAAWIEEAPQATGVASIRKRRLPAEQVVWLVLGMALYRDWSISRVVNHLHLASATRTRRGGRYTPPLRAPNSTSPSRLKSSDHRYDDRLALSGELAYRLTGELTAKLDAKWIKRDTNYPDYVPGVLPASQFFDIIQWNYKNAWVLASVEYRH